jgi:endonuclease-3
MATKKARAQNTPARTRPAQSGLARNAGAKKAPARSRKRRVDLRPERLAAIFEALHRAYPDAQCALVHADPWQLLVATILSAQCTDARVNQVTPVLFARFPKPADLAAANPAEVEEIIRPTGFYRNKTKSILGAARTLLAHFGGEVPRTMAELLTVPGAARKTANVVLGVAYGVAEGVVVDTHVLRLSRRLQLSASEEPTKVEQDLMKIVPREHWIRFSHELILHGRAVCVARKPRCLDCVVETQCHSPEKTWSSF